MSGASYLFPIYARMLWTWTNSTLFSQPVGKIVGCCPSVFHAQRPLMGHCLLIIEVSRSHSFGHTTLGRTPLDEWSVWRRDLYVTTHNINKKGSHACGGNRTHNPSKGAAADPRVRPCCYRARHFTIYHLCRCRVTYAAGVLLTFKDLPISHSVNKVSLPTACVEVNYNSASSTIHCLSSQHLGKVLNLVKWQ
jgi:hypothetical protein